jgi:Zn-finger nucleic acid-binding protein
MARPTLAHEPARVLGCVRCKNPMSAIDIGAASVIHACTQCRSMFVPPRGWTRAFSAPDVAANLEQRIGAPARAELLPLASCPVCTRQMDRTRFAATSEVVFDACSEGHGVWLASGDLGRAVDYAAHKARIGVNAAVREADAAWMKANNIDPRRHAIETEETRARAASAARLSKYAKGGGAGVILFVVLRVLLMMLDRQHHSKTAVTHGGPVQTAGAQGAADLQ